MKENSVHISVMTKVTPNASSHSLCYSLCDYYKLLFTYFLSIADPECQPGGGDPSVDIADLTLLQVTQGEQINSPGRQIQSY